MMFRSFSRTGSCPSCGGAEVYRLKRSGVANRIVCKVSNYRPYWCSSCDTFFYAPRGSKAVNVEERLGIPRQQNLTAKRRDAGGLAH